MNTCQSGRHTWLSATDAARCCNGYRRELRLDTLEPTDSPELAMQVRLDRTRAWWVWVPTGETP